MKIEGEGRLLRIFVGETDRWKGAPLYESIVRREGLAGATVLRGPVVVEIVDRPDRIDGFLPILDEMVEEGMVTLETVHIVAYRSGEESHLR